jgi:hypothetical protein
MSSCKMPATNVQIKNNEVFRKILLEKLNIICLENFYNWTDLYHVDEQTDIKKLILTIGELLAKAPTSCWSFPETQRVLFISHLKNFMQQGLKCKNINKY